MLFPPHASAWQRRQRLLSLGFSLAGALFLVAGVAYFIVQISHSDLRVQARDSRPHNLASSP